MPASVAHVVTNIGRIEEAKNPQLVKILKDSKREVKKRLSDTGLKPAEVDDPTMWSQMTWALVIARAEELGLATELPGTRGQQARRAARVAAGLPVRRTKAQKIADESAKAAASTPTSDDEEDSEVPSDPYETEDDNDEQDNS